MEGMKRLALLLSCLAALASGAELSDVHTVYVLKMSKGLDQYLANRLTNEHVFQIVTDPKLADAVLTEHIGDSFQAKLDELFPPPEIEKPEKLERPENAEKAEKPEKTKKKKNDEANANPLITDTVNKLSNPASSSSFGRAAGTLFLVVPKSHQVVWSAFQMPKDSSSREMDRLATDLVGRLKKDLGRK
jgi:hypothetical protein